MAKNVIRVIAFAVDLETGKQMVVDVFECIQTRRSHLNVRKLKRWCDHGANDWHGPVTRFQVERRKVNAEDRANMARVGIVWEG
jgi:hypothetical protein